MICWKWGNPTTHTHLMTASLCLHPPFKKIHKSSNCFLRKKEFFVWNVRQQSLWAVPGRQESNIRSIFSFEEIHCSYSNKVIHSHVIIQTKQHIPVFEKTVPCEPFGIQAAQCDRIIRNCPDTFKTNSWNEAYWKSKLFCQKIGLEHGNYQVQSQNCKCSLIWSNHHFNLRKHICCLNILLSDFFFCLKHLYCCWMTVMRSIYPYQLSAACFL